jgi:hypothetical protein
MIEAMEFMACGNCRAQCANPNVAARFRPSTKYVLNQWLTGLPTQAQHYYELFKANRLGTGKPSQSDRYYVTIDFSYI